MTRLLVLAVLIASVASWGNVVAAQDVPEVTLPEPVLLAEGQRAPFRGQLMAQEDVLTWAHTIEDLEHRLAAEVQRYTDLCEARLTGERARTEAAASTTALHDALYQQRVEALAAESARFQRSAMREWWEHPALWFAVGVVVTSVAVIAVVATQ